MFLHSPKRLPGLDLKSAGKVLQPMLFLLLGSRNASKQHRWNREYCRLGKLNKGMIIRINVYTGMKPIQKRTCQVSLLGSNAPARRGRSAADTSVYALPLPFPLVAFTFFALISLSLLASSAFFPLSSSEGTSSSICGSHVSTEQHRENAAAGSPRMHPPDQAQGRLQVSSRTCPGLGLCEMLWGAR